MKILWMVVGWLSVWGWTILLVFGIIGIFACATKSDSLGLDISVSLFTSAIFFLFVTFLSDIYKKHQNKRIINCYLFKMKEALRLCKNSIYPAFDLTFKPNGENKDEYVRDFEKTNFGEYWIQPKTRFQKFEEEKNNVKNIANYLQMFDTLSLTQKNAISEILSSILVTEEFRTIPSDLNEEKSLSYSSNQKEMGECVFHLYEIIRKLK